MITVHLPPDLAGQFGAPPVLRSGAGTGRELLQELDRQYPGLSSWLAEADGRFRQHLSVFVEGRRLESRAAVSTEMPEGAEIWILRAISGG